ncbi:helix-turn-helix domain-containing protein [Haematospirillum jordaniae]|uniref:Uncharacterized protein n=1 Tax=Haematospirillum jordaniae TaxID=1549855 RepID=A0A143DEN5_9PROT|nr:helix-turn-helix domain-containing protein [Haematospirillum jordaniae]AMW35195.1 hypothetical protein AY555_08430 [Haematospirillum jordaniae]NKD56409.1 helix-turn-helix domain-containing protein [Haematospirillum jordaniae]NKD58467.1 helix-turn-helix domain-containing protein [Haematospirillum jordaniae]NKD66364.1 helix-turn-helix domain-containing protein [Haematospirillum jordaniae]NKD78469.1 helix-turn-helix domain-containing protein [Haematospirillum jordaniae]
MIKTGKGPKAITSVKSIREAEQRAEMLSLRLEGKTLEQIGAHMNVGADTVHRVISRALTSVTKEPAEELLTLELGRCDVLLTEAMQTVKAFHPLVSAGRVVSAPMLNNQGEPIRNPETGDVLTRVLEDKAPKLAAIHVAVKVMERRAKLLRYVPVLSLVAMLTGAAVVGHAYRGAYRFAAVLTICLPLGFTPCADWR